MSRGLLGRNSPLHIRQRRRDALKEADVVILAGEGKPRHFCSLYLKISLERVGKMF